MKGKWSPAHLAPEGVVVRTKIDDANGVRNEGELKRRGRKMKRKNQTEMDL